MGISTVLIHPSEARAIIRHKKTSMHSASSRPLLLDPVWYLDQIIEAEYSDCGKVLICRLPKGEWFRLEVIK